MATDDPRSPQDQIVDAATRWPGVTAGEHRFGGVELLLGRRELGHVHGDRWADLPFPKRIRDELIAGGRAQPHHVLPDTGWVTVPLGSREAVDNVIDLLRLSYDRASAASARQAGPR